MSWNDGYQQEEAEAREQAIAAAVGDSADREMDRMEARWATERAPLVDQIKHMANVTHQAHHQDAGCGWLECPRALCADARQAIGTKPPRGGGK